MQDWTSEFEETVTGYPVKYAIPTVGPANRYRYALFVEKEGFNELWESVKLAERFDLAIMSTKGMSVTAARQLVERLSERGVTILVLRDFDKAGFSIAHTLKWDTRRYRYKTRPRIIDLGLRLSDVKAMGLQSEAVEYAGKVDPKSKLRECGATTEECAFLVTGGSPWSGWRGQRVEINAMTSDQLVQWLEEKLKEIGVKKVVPDKAVLESAYRRAVRLAALEDAIEAAVKDYAKPDIDVPSDLEETVRKELEEYTDLAWDDAVRTLVRLQRLTAEAFRDLVDEGEEE